MLFDIIIVDSVLIELPRLGYLDVIYGVAFTVCMAQFVFYECNVTSTCCAWTGSQFQDVLLKFSAVILDHNVFTNNHGETGLKIAFYSPNQCCMFSKKITCIYVEYIKHGMCRTLQTYTGLKFR